MVAPVINALSAEDTWSGRKARHSVIFSDAKVVQGLHFMRHLKKAQNNVG